MDAQAFPSFDEFMSLSFLYISLKIWTSICFEIELKEKIIDVLLFACSHVF